MKKEKKLSLNRPSISSHCFANLVKIGQFMCLLLGLNVLSVAQAGPVFSTPLACDPVLYQSIGDKLMALDPITGQYNKVGLTSASKYNAIGWDTRTNFIYGYRKKVFTLFRIDSTGKTANLGAVTDENGATLEARTQAGDMDDSGNLWVYDRFVPMSLFKINVDTKTSEEVVFTGVAVDSPNDIVYIKSTNSFWGINKTNNTLVRFNLATQVISTMPITGLPAFTGTGYGAAWTNSSNELIISNNNGGVYRINNYLTVPSASFLIASAVTSKNDGASCPLAPPVFNFCTGFSGEVTEVSLPILAQLKTTDKLFVPSKDVLTSKGHLKAYSIDANGKPATKESWDVANLMAGRTSKLYSSDASGNKILFNSLDVAAFASANALTIKAATIAAKLGGVSKGNNIDILSNNINTSLYLSETAYRSYYSASVSSRAQQVLMSSDDGFLYAFDASNGALVWAWMPRSLVSELAGGATFQNKHLMSGSIDILDLPDSSGSYSTYIVGSYKSGLGHYVLKLAGNGNLAQVVWDDDQSAGFTESPNNGEMEFFKDGGGLVYASYVLTNSTLTSRVKIRSLVDSSKNDAIALSYQATSTPFMMQNYGRSNAPAKKTLYIGTSLGNIHAAEIIDSSGSFNSVASIKLSLEGSSVTTLYNTKTDAVLYIDASVSANDNKYYLSSQTATRLTIHRYKSSDSSWNKAWTSYSSGAGSWNNSGKYTADTSGVPTNKGGFAIIPPSGIQSLPVDAMVTDKATIVGDMVILPLSVASGDTTICYGKAYYYIYSLSDGTFPTNKIFTINNTVITTNIALGYGEARRISTSNLAGTSKLIAYGIADKKVDLSSGIATSFVIKDPATGGIRAWKEIGR